MTSGRGHDVGASVRARLGNLARAQGVAFDFEAARIKDDDEYEGVRVRLQADLAGARIPVQVDVGFGDSVRPVEDDYPVLLEDSPVPRLRTYPREAVVAEKVHAMVYLGLANSRMKDFWDVDHLARHFAFEGAALLEAVTATFERRRTAIPDKAPVAFSSSFGTDRTKQQQWAAFLKRTELSGATLAELVADVSAFVLPILDAYHGGPALDAWPPGGPWTVS